MNTSEPTLADFTLTVFDSPNLDEKRLRANLALVQNLHDLVEKNPHLRFSQILFNFGFVTETTYGSWKDEFFAEPEKTLERVESRRRQERVGPGLTERSESGEL